MKKIILVGGLPETIELCELCGYKIIGIIDYKDEERICGHPVLGKDHDAAKIRQKLPGIPVLIAVDKPAVRKNLVNIYHQAGFLFASLISQKAYISPSAKLGEGVIIQSFCNVSTNVGLGDFVKVNTYANIMHDCVLEPYSTIAPNAALMGHVYVGEASYIGANATIIQSNCIGRSVIVGAGAVVTKNITDGLTIVGIPAKPMLEGYR